MYRYLLGVSSLGTQKSSDALTRDLLQEWYSNVLSILSYINKTQLGNIKKAANVIADTIIKGHVCFLFGSGHAAIPVMEIFPRYGSLIGFMPIVDLPLVSFLRLVGDMGYPQFDYLENSPEYGARIIDNYEVHEEDCAILFSHSGTTPVTLEVALRIKNRGSKVIGVTSVSHSLSARPRHPSGLKLFEVADVVIDTGVPPGDVSLEVSNGNRLIRVGPLSTMAFVFVANLILLGTYERLLEIGYDLTFLPVRAFDPDAEALMKKALSEYRKLYLKHISK